MLVTMRNYANGGAVVWCHRQPAVCTFLMQSGSLLTPRTEEREREREREREGYKGGGQGFLLLALFVVHLTSTFLRPPV